MEVMTLKEFALILRKCIKFNYLTAERYHSDMVVSIYMNQPTYVSYGEHGGGWDTSNDDTSASVCAFYKEELAVKLDLSEYEDASGEVDYSKCVVRVEG